MSRRGRKGRPLSGWLVLDKPSGIGSTPALTRVRRLFNVQKLGHAGTLDPLASGILPIAFGEATKLIHLMMDAPKTYACRVQFGQATDTDDADGTVIAEHAHRPAREAVEAALTRFTGDILQRPPAYSAIKKEGKRAYDLARAGQAPDLAARPVTIHHIELLDFCLDSVSLRVFCGKGTYIRSLARDLALECGTVGHISYLRREAVGLFSQSHAIKLEKLEEISHSAPDLVELDRHLLPLETLLDDIPALPLTEEMARKLRHGQAIPAPKGEFPIWAAYQGQAVALGITREGVFEPQRIIHPPPGANDME